MMLIENILIGVSVLVACVIIFMLAEYLGEIKYGK